MLCDKALFRILSSWNGKRTFLSSVSYFLIQIYHFPTGNRQSAICLRFRYYFPYFWRHFTMLHGVEWNINTSPAFHFSHLLMARSDTAPASIHFIFNGVMVGTTCTGNLSVAMGMRSPPLRYVRVPCQPSVGWSGCFESPVCERLFTLLSGRNPHGTRYRGLNWSSHGARPPPVRRNQPQRLIRQRSDQVPDVLKLRRVFQGRMSSFLLIILMVKLAWTCSVWGRRKWKDLCEDSHHLALMALLLRWWRP